MSVPLQNSRRKEQDVLKLVKSYKVDVIEKWKLLVHFYGPPDTPYHGGVWKVLVHIPTEYPFKSPSISFMNRIFHPNINWESGKVCLDVLDKNWSSLFNLNVIFDTFLPQLLVDPNPDDPFHCIAAVAYKHWPKNFNGFVKRYVKEYAMDEGHQAGSVEDSMSPNPFFSGSSTGDEAAESGQQHHV